MGVEVVVLQIGDGQRPRVGGMTWSRRTTWGLLSATAPPLALAWLAKRAALALAHSGTPFVTEIGVGKAIKGWDEGVLQLTRGSRAILRVSPDYAYGTRGFPPVIPPNATLEFVVELLEIKPSKLGVAD